MPLTGTRHGLTVPALTSAANNLRHSAAAPRSSFSTSHQQNKQQPDPRSPTAAAAADWSATQYLKFGRERTRAVHDLVANIPLAHPRRIVDLGCGPGNSTAVLAARWPAAQLTGVDASPAMLACARARAGAGAGAASFVHADLRTYAPAGPRRRLPDLLFSNAAFHWLRRAQRLPTVRRLLGAALRAGGGVLALQVPDNHAEPSHAAMREVAARAGPWAAGFAAAAAAAAGGAEDAWPDLDPVETPAEWYEALAPLCARVDVWHVVYQHVLEGPGAIVEWVKGSGLRPFLNALPSQEVKDAYLMAYEQRLREVYPPLADGKVMLRYPRLFVVATKK